MTADEYAELLELALAALTDVAEDDWSRRAGTLEWTCWQTVDHMVDCVFSYVMQIAARADGGFLPFHELHAKPEAVSGDLIAGLHGTGTMFLAVVRDAPPETMASDGLQMLDLSDWCARAAHETAIHTHDTVSTFGRALNVPNHLSSAILASEALWALDRERASTATNPWNALLLASGRR